MPPLFCAMLYLIIFLICAVAAIAMACAINYFLRLGPWKSLGYAVFVIGIFLIFASSGIWEDVPRHDWGSLTPAFALLLAGGFLCLKFGKKAWLWWRKKEKNYQDDGKWY